MTRGHSNDCCLSVYHSLLAKSQDGCLPKGAVKEVDESYCMHRKTVWRYWKLRKDETNKHQPLKPVANRKNDNGKEENIRKTKLGLYLAQYLTENDKRFDTLHAVLEFLNPLCLTISKSVKYPERNLRYDQNYQLRTSTSALNLFILSLIHNHLLLSI